MCLCVQFKPSDDDNDDYGHWTVNKGYDLISLQLAVGIYLWSCKWYLKVFCIFGVVLSSVSTRTQCECVCFCKHIVLRIVASRLDLIYIPMSSVHCTVHVCAYAWCKSVQCILKRTKSNYYLFYCVPREWLFTYASDLHWLFQFFLLLFFMALVQFFVVSFFVSNHLFLKRREKKPQALAKKKSWLNRWARFERPKWRCDVETNERMNVKHPKVENILNLWHCIGQRSIIFFRETD